MSVLCLVFLFNWCVSTTIFFFFPGVSGREQAVRISSLAAELVFSLILSDSVFTDGSSLSDWCWWSLHAEHIFYCLWCVMSRSGCRNLICNSCACLFVDLIGLSAPREITLLWQMLLNVLFLFYLYYWWYGTILVLAWHVQTKSGFLIAMFVTSRRFQFMHIFSAYNEDFTKKTSL